MLSRKALVRGAASAAVSRKTGNRTLAVALVVVLEVHGDAVLVLAAALVARALGLPVRDAGRKLDELVEMLRQVLRLRAQQLAHLLLLVRHL